MAQREPHILVVDDESGIRAVLTAMLVRGGFSVTPAASGDEAFRLLARKRFDCVVSDLAMGSGMNGMALLRIVRERFPAVPFVMITAFSTVEVAASAMREGAYDFIRKPFRMDDLFSVCRGALHHQRVLSGGSGDVFPSESPPLHFGRLVGEGWAMQAAYRLIDESASLDTPVLLQGEQGTGRRCVARVLHAESRREDGPFCEIGCADRSPKVEAALFGPGNANDGNASESALTAAHTGTLFLREVDSLPLAPQRRLADLLRERTSSSSWDVRVIASSGCALQQKVEAGRFERRLYEQLSVLVIDVPSLRQRPEDIPAFVRYALEQMGEGSAGLPCVGRDTLEMLRRYSWPGNLNELRDALRHAVEQSDRASLRPEHFPPTIPRRVPGTSHDTEGDGEEGLRGAHAGAYLREARASYHRARQRRNRQ